MALHDSHASQNAIIKLALVGSSDFPIFPARMQKSPQKCGLLMA
jgi:hypothetical protein